MLVARTPFPEGVRTVLFERSSPGIMDSDGCSSAVKSVRDAVAAWRSGVDVTAGRGDDSPACGVEWTYASVRSKDYGVRVILLW